MILWKIKDFVNLISKDLRVGIFERNCLEALENIAYPLNKLIL